MTHNYLIFRNIIFASMNISPSSEWGSS